MEGSGEKVRVFEIVRALNGVDEAGKSVHPLLGRLGQEQAIFIR